jgi:hypothetical protein
MTDAAAAVRSFASTAGEKSGLTGANGGLTVLTALTLLTLAKLSIKRTAGRAMTTNEGILKRSEANRRDGDPT